MTRRLPRRFVLICSVSAALIFSRAATAATTADELVGDLKAAFDAHDRAKFGKCFNTDGVDENTKHSIAKLIDIIFSWPTCQIVPSDRRDVGGAAAERNGKIYRLNGQWLSMIHLNTEVLGPSNKPSATRPHTKGFSLPAGLIDARYQILAPVEQR